MPWHRATGLHQKMSHTRRRLEIHVTVCEQVVQVLIRFLLRSSILTEEGSRGVAAIQKVYATFSLSARHRPK